MVSLRVCFLFFCLVVLSIFVVVCVCVGLLVSLFFFRVLLEGWVCFVFSVSIFIQMHCIFVFVCVSRYISFCFLFEVLGYYTLYSILFVSLIVFSNYPVRVR